MDDDLAVIGLDLREEFDAAAELAVGHLHRDEQERGERQRRGRDGAARSRTVRM